MKIRDKKWSSEIPPPIQIKALMQGKLFQRCAHFLYCSVLSLGGKVNSRRMSKSDMESIFTKIIYEIFWSQETIFLKLSNYFSKLSKLKVLSSSDTRQTLMHIYSCLQIPPRENWFQYVRRVYATAIIFPCISTLIQIDFLKWSTWPEQLVKD